VDNFSSCVELFGTWKLSYSDGNAVWLKAHRFSRSIIQRVQQALAAEEAAFFKISSSTYARSVLVGRLTMVRDRNQGVSHGVVQPNFNTVRWMNRARVSVARAKVEGASLLGLEALNEYAKFLKIELNLEIRHRIQRTAFLIVDISFNLFDLQRRRYEAANRKHENHG